MKKTHLFLLMLVLSLSLVACGNSSDKQEEKVEETATPEPEKTEEPTPEPTEDTTPEIANYNNEYVQCQYDSKILQVITDSKVQFRFFLQNKDKPYEQKDIDNRMILMSDEINSTKEDYETFKSDKEKFIKNYANEIIDISSNPISNSTVNDSFDSNGTIECIVASADNTKEYKVKILYFDSKIASAVFLGIDKNADERFNSALQDCYDSFSMTNDFLASQEQEKVESDTINYKDSQGNELKYIEHKKVEDFEGKPALAVYYEYTNNTQTAQTPMYAVSFKAFQDGVECSNATLLNPESEYQNTIKEIKPGKTVKICWYYMLEGDSDVDLEVSPLLDISGDETVTQTIKVK